MLSRKTSHGLLPKMRLSSACHVLLLLVLAASVARLEVVAYDRIMNPPEWVPWIAIAPDGTTLARSSRLGLVLFDLAHGRLLRHVTAFGGWKIKFSPDSRVLGGIVESGKLFIWKINEAQPTLSDGFSGHAEELAFSPDSQMLAAACQDGVIRIWSVESRRIVQSLKEPPSSRGECLTYIDTKQLASASATRKGYRIAIWDIEKSRVKGSFTGPEFCYVRNLTWCPVNRLLAWSLTTGPVTRLLQVPTPVPVHMSNDSVTTLSFSADRLAFSPDGNSMAATGLYEVIAWQPAKQQTLARIAASDISALAYARSDVLLLADENGTVGWWNLQTGAIDHHLHGLTLAPSEVPWLLVTISLGLLAVTLTYFVIMRRNNRISHDQLVAGTFLQVAGTLLAVVYAIALSGVVHSKSDPLPTLSAAELMFVCLSLVLGGRGLRRMWSLPSQVVITAPVLVYASFVAALLSLINLMTWAAIVASV
jgi:hypothetical protein